MATPAPGGATLSRSSKVSWSAGARNAVGPLGLGIAIVVAAVVISVVVVSGAFGGSNKTEPSPGASNQSGAAAVLGSSNLPAASPSVEASVDSAAPSESPLGIPIEEVGGGRQALKPGTYTAVILPGTPSMTVADDGWSVLDSSDGDMVLGRTTTPTDRIEIRWVDNLSSDVCGLQSPIAVGPNPESQFEAWAHGMTGLQLGPGAIRQFGDLTTEEYDVSVLARTACQYSTPVAVVATPYVVGVGLFSHGQAIGTTNLSFNAGVLIRIEVTSRDGQLILIVIQSASAAQLGTFKPLAEKILATLSFGP